MSSSNPPPSTSKNLLALRGRPPPPPPAGANTRQPSPSPATQPVENNYGASDASASVLSRRPDMHARSSSLPTMPVLPDATSDGALPESGLERRPPGPLQQHVSSE